MSPKIRWLLLALAWAAGLFAWALRGGESYKFVQLGAQNSETLGSTPVFIRHELKTDALSAHAATIAISPQGAAHAFWFAGTREGAGDVQIYSAQRSNGLWSIPEPVRSVKQTIRDQWRFVRKVGNPVAHFDAQGRLHLFFVSVSLGGWATSHINHTYSDDDGKNWSRSRILHLSPFLNISTLARAVPVEFADGSLGLPAYHESARKFPELLRITRDGNVLGKTRMSAQGGLLQPTLATQSEQEAIALLRDGGPLRKIHLQRTLDGGAHWSKAIPLDVANPNASIAVARLKDGQFLLAYNPRIDDRSELALAISSDGTTWQKVKVIESAAGGEFSYPTLASDRTGTLHLVYTWQRKHIRHVMFNRAWLSSESEDKP